MSRRWDQTSPGCLPGARKTFSFVTPLLAPAGIQKNREQLQVKGFGVPGFGALVVSFFFCKALFLHPTPPSLLMNGLRCEMQSKNDTAHSLLPDQASPSCLGGQALAVQGSPMSCSWHWVAVGGRGPAQLQLRAKPRVPSLSIISLLRTPMGKKDGLTYFGFLCTHFNFWGSSCLSFTL